MKRIVKIMLSLALASLICSMCAVTAFAEDEATIFYFVDCGDYLVDTVSEGDQFGQYNSVTDQFFGEDPETGMQWGVVDEAYDEASSTEKGDTRVNTTWTWAYEYNTAGMDVPKEQSNRYCHNMTENGLDRVLTYKFQMPEDGKYVVEVGFSCPWGNSSPVDLYLNGELLDQMVFIDTNSNNYAYTTVSPVDGFITVEARTMAATINMTYIIISDVLTNETNPFFEESDDPPEPEVTLPVTQAPATNAPESTAPSTDGSSTEAGNTDDSSGCGSTLGAFAVIATVVSGTAVVIKKKSVK